MHKPIARSTAVAYSTLTRVMVVGTDRRPVVRSATDAPGGNGAHELVQPAGDLAEDRVAAGVVGRQGSVLVHDEELVSLAVRVVPGARHRDRAGRVLAIRRSVLDRSEAEAGIGCSAPVERAALDELCPLVGEPMTGLLVKYPSRTPWMNEDTVCGAAAPSSEI